MDSHTKHTPALSAANNKLLELRANHKRTHANQKHFACERSPSIREVTSQSLCDLDDLNELPSHLGWGSSLLTEALRARKTPIPQTRPKLALAFDSERARPLPKQKVKNSETIKLYPDIGLGMLREGLSSPGRLWLLLRWVNKSGSGVLRVANVVNILTDKTSNLFLCGKRQLRNLLREGKGVFWTRDKHHIWLHSAAKVARSLNVERLTGRPVALSTEMLLNGIGGVRAYLYAAFHCGRAKQEKQAKPISREKISNISAVGESSQRTYEKRSGLRVTTNFAIGHVSSEENRESCVWKHGRAVFDLVDYRGQNGKAGNTYLAWQLPNSYGGQLQHQPRGRQRRINRELKDLVMKGMPGNSRDSLDAQGSQLQKVYHANGKSAAVAVSRSNQTSTDIYWKRHAQRNGRYTLWQKYGR